MPGPEEGPTLKGGQNETLCIVVRPAPPVAVNAKATLS